MLQLVDYLMEMDAVALRVYRNLAAACGADGSEQVWAALSAEKRRKIEQWRVLRGGLEAGLVPSPVANLEVARHRAKGKLERLVGLETASAAGADFKTAAEIAVRSEAVLLDADALRLLKVSRIYGLSQGEDALESPAVGRFAALRERAGDTVVAFADTVVRLYEAHERLGDREDRDPVTGARSRSVLFQHGKFLVDWACRYAKTVGLLQVRVDDFQSIVRQYGHAAADGLLAAMHNRLAAVTRRTDWTVRNGADDFVILVLGTPEEGLAILGGKILEQVRSPVFHLGRVEIPTSASIGICVYPTDGVTDPTVELLLHLAGKALEEARQAGGNCMVVADQSMVP